MRTKAKLLALRYAEIKLLIVRRTLRELQNNHIDPLRQELAGVAKYKAADKRFEFPNGSVLTFGYCACDGDLGQYQGAEYDVVVNVQGDEPFIRSSQLETVKRCFDDPSTDIATLVKPFTEADGLDALENPNSPKVVLGSADQALYFSRSVIPYLRGVPREEWLARHTFYKHIGMYAFRRETLYKVTALPQSALERAESLEQLRWLENGFRIRAGISDVETIGIDTPEDLAKAEEFLKLKMKN